MHSMIVEVNLDVLLKSKQENVVRLAKWVNAQQPKDTNPKAHQYRLACNVMRAIHRSKP